MDTDISVLDIFDKFDGSVGQIALKCRHIYRIPDISDERFDHERSDISEVRCIIMNEHYQKSYFYIFMYFYVNSFVLIQSCLMPSYIFVEPVWRNDRAYDAGPRNRGFETRLNHLVFP